MMMNMLALVLISLVVLGGATAQTDIPGVCEYTRTRPPALEPSQQYSRGNFRGGSLIVAGGSLTNDNRDVWDRFLQLAGGAEARIVYIPTNDGGVYDTPAQLEAARLNFERLSGFSNVTILHTYDRAPADTEAFAAVIDQATGVWLTGGRQWLCADAYGTYLNPTLTLKAMYGLLERGGVIGGTSAGAAIQGDLLLRGDTGTNLILLGDHQEGFGFVENVGFEPHLLHRSRDDDMLEVVRSFPEILGIGMDEQTAVEIQGDELRVIGRHFAQITDSTLWDDKRYCSFGLTQGVGRMRPSNGGTSHWLSTGDRYNIRTREVTGRGFREADNRMEL